MSQYRHGVLIHNYNEDKFGVDSLSIPKVDQSVTTSTTHKLHDWKQPSNDKQPPPPAKQNLEGHIFFGHTGDMTDPRTNFNKRTFGSANQYFYQGPEDQKATLTAKVPITGDNFADTEQPMEVDARSTSVLADARRKQWKEDMDTLKTPFTSCYNRTITADAELEEGDKVRHDRGFMRPPGVFSKRARELAIIRKEGKV